MSSTRALPPNLRAELAAEATSFFRSEQQYGAETDPVGDIAKRIEGRLTAAGMSKADAVGIAHELYQEAVDKFATSFEPKAPGARAKVIPGTAAQANSSPTTSLHPSAFPKDWSPARALQSNQRAELAAEAYSFFLNEQRYGAETDPVGDIAKRIEDRVVAFGRPRAEAREIARELYQEAVDTFGT